MSEKDQTIAASFNTEIMNRVNSPATHIELFHQGEELSFSKDELPIKLGRDNTICDIVVNSEVASRVHCMIEVRDGQIGLVDKSTNGTFIRIGRNDCFVIKNSFYPLIGKGNIKLGEQFDADETDIVYYRMVTK